MLNYIAVSKPYLNLALINLRSSTETFPIINYINNLWPPQAKSWLIGKDPDAGRDWGQEEKGMIEHEMAGWHHWLNGRESEWTPGAGDGQRGLACCDSWGRKESDTTERLTWRQLLTVSGDFLSFIQRLTNTWEYDLWNETRTTTKYWKFSRITMKASAHFRFTWRENLLRPGLF